MFRIFSRKTQNSSWALDSWQNYPARFQPNYEEHDLFQEIIAKLELLPSLVSFQEITTLKEQIRQAQSGHSFLFIAGDCAEAFRDCRSDLIEAKFRQLKSLSIKLEWFLRKPIILLGRMAGQYAKPRTEPYQTIAGQQVPNFWGDNVNSIVCDPVSKRNPDPRRLLLGYKYSALTLNFLRHLQLDYLARRRLTQVVEPFFYIAHEALLLRYEQSFTRTADARKDFFDLSAHFLWIGERTLYKSSAHLEFCRGIANPIGLKVGPSLDANDLVDMIHYLNPDNEKGRIVLITRLGKSHVEDRLALLIKEVQKNNLKVLWVCDPMHGNTYRNEQGVKYRHIDDIWAEMELTWKIHQQYQSHLGGLHLEVCPQEVAEVKGGAYWSSEYERKFPYESYCDPRLNSWQAHEIVDRFVKLCEA